MIHLSVILVIVVKFVVVMIGIYKSLARLSSEACHMYVSFYGVQIQDYFYCFVAVVLLVENAFAA